MTMISNITSVRNNTFANYSTSAPRIIKITGPDWTFTPVFYAVIAVLSFLTNGIVLTFFLVKPSLRTPFNIYLLNLVINNFLFTVLKMPADTINTLYSGWWLSTGYCSLNFYGSYVLGGGIRMSHALITINRVWAVIWPHSYRQHHSLKLACLICVAGSLFIHALVMPGLIREFLFYQFPRLVTTCRINSDAQWGWFYAVQIVFTLLFFVVVGSYPVIWIMRRNRRSPIRPVKKTKSIPAVATNQAAVARSETVLVELAGPAALPSLHSSHPSQQTTQTDPENHESGKLQQQPVILNTAGQRIQGQSRAFTILTLITAGAVIYRTPILVFYHMSVWGPVNPVLFRIAIVMSSLQSVVDPILFVCALPDLRGAFLKVLRRKRV